MLDCYSFKKIKKSLLLIIGHPRCGSGYASELSKSYGLDVGHESMGRDGISSWMFAVDSWDFPFGNGYANSTFYNRFDHVVQHIRNPFDAIPSIIVENRVSRSYAFRDKFIRERFGISMNDFSSEVNRAALSFVCWNLICEEKKPEIVFRVEDEGDVFGGYLSDNLKVGQKCCDLSRVNTSEQHYTGGIQFLDNRHLEKVDVKVFKKPKMTDSAWGLLDPELERKLLNFCDAYGYMDTR